MSKYAALFLISLLIITCFSCSSENQSPAFPTTPYLVILGTVQDGGSPHIGCKKDCCKGLFGNPDPSRKVVSLGLVDPHNNTKYLFEATPDFTEQVRILSNHVPEATSELPNGIFLTHAHIGHYTGLMSLGREAMGSINVPVYAMPKMTDFLKNHGPWSQLVSLNNIKIKPLQENAEVKLSSEISVTPFTVPHRDEYSETVGYQIQGPQKTALFIPDIDKWEKWEKSIIDEISKVDYAFIDASFFDGNEINNRDISEIPHPFVIESLSLFENLPSGEKQKIKFIHFNHTNPLLDLESPQYKQVIEQGFGISSIKDIIPL